jgi:hypothetical protein
VLIAALAQAGLPVLPKGNSAVALEKLRRAIIEV